MSDFYGLLGVIAEDASNVLTGICEKFSINSQKYNLTNAAFVVSQNPIIPYPLRIDANGKSLILFGNFFLKDITLEEYLNSPVEHMREILGKNNTETIPLSFVNGAYAGVICEGDRYIIFNDFFGLQPLYYSKSQGRIIISTSFKLLCKYLGDGLDINAVNEYLLLGGILSGRTIKKDINNLPPASNLIIGKNYGIEIKNYSTFPEDTLTEESLDVMAEKIRESFRCALQRIYSKKMKYCLNLTGGADTRLIFFEWPDRESLLTETAGPLNGSDVLKAKELVQNYGKAQLHALEELNEEKYFDGFKKYYDTCDNPLNIKQNFNFYHLQWKISRQAKVRLYGAGEVLGGENLYLSRSPLYLLSEMFFSYRYHSIKNSDKAGLMQNMLKAAYRRSLGKLLMKDLQQEPGLEEVFSGLENYLGQAKFKETFIERFRTYVVALAGYLPFSEVIQNKYIFVSPYCDKEFIDSVLKYHPKYRELRKLQLYILKKYHGYCKTPLDTTHLAIGAPYYLHKICRVPRFILNIGFHRKVPLLQRGLPPTDRVDAYVMPQNQDFREFVKKVILDCPVFDKKNMQLFFKHIEATKRFNFFSHHKEIANLYFLFRLAYAYKTIAS